jgi:hypothetical protein
VCGKAMLISITLLSTVVPDLLELQHSAL